jgi:sphingomyelin phosphodiesterase acid-like 3
MPTARQRIAAVTLLLFAVNLHAAPKPHTPAPTIPAVLLSDTHLDPYSDPAKVPELIAAPASDWPRILASPDSPTRAKDFADVQSACPAKGADTDERLWQSTLAALHTHSAGARFATVTGDLLAHAFDCKFHRLAPKASPQDYLAFTAKTVQYLVSGLQSAMPGVPIYFALGNNDSACPDYHLEPTADPFLTAVAPMLAAAAPPADRESIAAGRASAGQYSAPLVGVPDTRVIALDDVYFSTLYANCAGQPDPRAAAAQLDWLNAQLSAARTAHQRVWFLGHIPPGINLYASAKKMLLSCSASSAQTFLASDSLATALAANSDLIPLALFGHTHSDEIRLLTPAELAPDATAHAQTAGVPVKIVPSITPINGNLPAFVIAKIRPATATLADYTVIEASNGTGVNTTWHADYTYSTRYHKRDFDSASVASLVHDFLADATLSQPASQAYIGSYTAGMPTPILQLAWHPYTCALSHISSKSFADCACGP